MDQLNLDSHGLPSILEVLGKEAKNVRFIRPELGKGITDLHVVDTSASPASNVLSVRSVSVGGDEVIPFHRHMGKEKLCILMTGQLTFFVLYPGRIVRTFVLSAPEDRLIIPAERPHAVWGGALNTSRVHNRMLVIGSTKNPQVDWEVGLGEVLLNKHIA